MERLVGIRDDPGGATGSEGGRTHGRQPFEVGDELDAVGCLAWREESEVWEPKVRERRSSFLPLAAVRLG